MESCGFAAPIRVIIQMGASEMLMILLRFGARIAIENASTHPIITILDRLNEYNRKYPYELVTCLKLILRSVRTIYLDIDKKEVKTDLSINYNYQRKVVLEKYEDLLLDHLIPSTRCGLQPVELKHLCRCQIREVLWRNFQLPFGIRNLPIPESLRKYLDLFED